MKRTPEIADVIAERELEARHRHTGESRRVIVRIGRPRPDSEPGGDWACATQIEGIGDDAATDAYGVDSTQALQLAMQMIAIRLENDAAELELTWLGGKDLGFTGPQLPEG